MDILTGLVADFHSVLSKYCGHFMKKNKRQIIDTKICMSIKKWKRNFIISPVLLGSSNAMNVAQ